MPQPFETARSVPSLVGDMFDPKSFDEPTLRAMWSFRRQFVELRDGASAERDFEGFASLVRQGSLCYAPRAADGSLLATGVWVVRRYVVAGKPATFVLVKALYAHPSFRGRARGALAVLEGTTRFIALYGVIHVGGPVLLPGYITLLRMSPEVWMPGEMPPEVSSLYRSAAAEIGGCDVETGTVREPVATTEPAPRKPRDPRLAAAWDRYLARYPAWAEGDIGFALARLDWRFVPRLLAEGAKRRSRAPSLQRPRALSVRPGGP